MHVGVLLACVAAHGVADHGVVWRLLVVLVSRRDVRLLQRLAQVRLVLVELSSRAHVVTAVREQRRLVLRLERVRVGCLVLLLVRRPLVYVILVLMLGNLIFLSRAKVAGDDHNVVDSGGWLELLVVHLLVFTAGLLVVPLVRVEPLPHHGGWSVVHPVDVMGRAPIFWVALVLLG